MKGENQKKCIVCGQTNVYLWKTSKDVEYLTSEESYDYLKCDSCSSIFIDPMPVSKISEIYPSNYYSFSAVKKNLVERVKELADRRMFRRILSRIQEQNIKVLDVGGGSGWLLDIVKASDSRVTFTQVVDIDEKAKVLAEAKGHKYFHGTIEEFETAEKFDLALMLNIVEHIRDPRETLNQIEKLLNPGGQVLIKTPNIESWDARLFHNSYWGGLHCPRHWILFSQNSFRHLIKDSKLKVKSIKYTQGAPFWAWSVLIKLKGLGMTKITRERPVMFHPLIPLLHAIFAAFDLVRGTLGAKTSQMFIELEKKS